MSARTRVRAAIGRHLREDELGKAAVAMALALLTVLAAVVAGLQGQASIEAARGNREAQRIGLEATGVNASNVIQTGTAYGIYRRWFEQVERANWASEQQTRAATASNKPQIDALQAAEASIAAWTKSQTDLLGPPYDNGTTTDFGDYEAVKLTGPRVLASERRAVEASVASAWDGKASGYVTVLTVLAVGLFFLGLGSTVGRRARPVLATAGVLFGVAALAWTVSIATAPIHRVPDDAIQGVVASEVSLAKAPNESGEATLSNTARNAYDAAVKGADAAVAADPDYASGFRARADAKTVYGDAIYFTSGPSDETSQILKGAVDDYHRYLALQPEDYTAWWNLGWAEYLIGDAPASVDATNQALGRAPGQFTLYLNRALAYLAGGDPQQAARDIDEAVRRAGQDSSDSAQYYLGESDFDLGRLEAVRPTQAEVLRTIQLRLREAQVSLHISGSPAPASDAPALGSVEVRPVQLKPYSGGVLVEGDPLADGARVDSTAAVGVRVAVAATPALTGRTLSARIWRNGVPQAGYNRDVAISGTTVTIDLVSPYGRAGFNLDAGVYQLDLYVDGARRLQAGWTVLPKPDHPEFVTGATPLITLLEGLGFTCDPPATANGRTTSNCSIRDNDETTYIADVTWDGQDRITYLVLSAGIPLGSTNDVNALGHQFFTYVAQRLYQVDVAQRAVDWINAQGVDPDAIDLGGTTLRVYGNDALTRNLDIWSPWP